MKCHLYSLQLLQYHLSYCLTYMSGRPHVGHGFGGGGGYEGFRLRSSNASNQYDDNDNADEQKIAL